MPGLVFTLWIAVALIAWDSYRAGELPPPRRFAWVAIVWSILGLIGTAVAPEIATLFAFGVLLAMAYDYLSNPANPADAGNKGKHNPALGGAAQ